MASLLINPQSNVVLKARLGRGYQIRLYIGTALISISYVVILLTLFLSCRPLHLFWQLNPDPGSM
jgi:hypothetical protein